MSSPPSPRASPRHQPLSPSQSGKRLPIALDSASLPPDRVPSHRPPPACKPSTAHRILTPSANSDDPARKRLKRPTRKSVPSTRNAREKHTRETTSHSQNLSVMTSHPSSRPSLGQASAVAVPHQEDHADIGDGDDNGNTTTPRGKKLGKIARRKWASRTRTKEGAASRVWDFLEELEGEEKVGNGSEGRKRRKVDKEDEEDRKTEKLLDRLEVGGVIYDGKVWNPKRTGI